MPFHSTSLQIAVTEWLLNREPTSALEAMLFFGFADLAKKVARLRQQGFEIETREVPLSTVLTRIEKTLSAPVPVHALVKAADRSLSVTEYRVTASLKASRERPKRPGASKKRTAGDQNEALLALKGD